MDGIKITKQNPVSVDRGEVYEWCRGIESRQITVYYRNKSEYSGNHYHKGDDPSKNPERFFLVSGRMRLDAYDGRSRMEEIIEQKTEVIIAPGILHTFLVEEDSVFIEHRATEFNRNHSDTYPADTYEEYLRSR